MVEDEQKKSVFSINIPTDSQFKVSDENLLNPNSDKSGCNFCRKKMILRRLPILQWLPKYTTSDAIGDLIAGVSVGITVIPQGLAYSTIANLPPEFGLYSAFVGCFVYVILGSCKVNTVGSTAVASLLVGQSSGGVWQRAILLTFLTGIIELIMAIFQLGFLVDFVSGPVNSGFTSAVALIILSSQVKSIFNIPASGSSFLEMWISIIKHITELHWPDTFFGFGCITLLLILRWIGGRRVGSKDESLHSGRQKFVNKFLWVLGISRNGTVLIISGLIGFYLGSSGQNKLSLVGAIPTGVPRIAVPPFSIPEIRGNGTNGEEIIIQNGESFFEMVRNIGTGLILVPLIALLENTSACKAFAKGKPIDVTQELIAIGCANIGNSFFSGYRANSGIGRSAVNCASGARTAMSNLHIGLIAVISLTFLTQYFSFIPRATLAGIAIAAVIFMVQYQVVMPMWRSRRVDLIPGFICFFACLILPLQIGILVGIAFNMIFLLYNSARPKVRLVTLETSTGQTFLMLTPDRCLMFPSVEFVRNIINKSGMKTSVPVVVDCTYVYGADFTAAKVISTMVADFNMRKQTILFYNLKLSVAKMFEGVSTNLTLCYSKEDLESELAKEQN